MNNKVNTRLKTHTNAVQQCYYCLQKQKKELDYFSWDSLQTNILLPKSEPVTIVCTFQRQI